MIYYKVLSIFFTCLSVAIVWSELIFSGCTIYDYDLSVFSLFIRAINHVPPFILQVCFVFIFPI